MEDKLKLRAWIIAAGAIATISAICIGAMVLLPSNSVNVPRRVPVHTITHETPRQTVTSPVPSRQVPSPTPKLKETVIYTVAYEMPDYWQISNVLADWSLADSYADFKEAKTCPQGLPCLVISLGRLPDTTAAETRFGIRDNVIGIKFNRTLHNPFAAHSTACHEVGHVLGLPHITGTVDTCMTPKDAFYRVRPTKVDTRLVNSYGPWEFWKMYELSGKDVDVRSQPR